MTEFKDMTRSEEGKKPTVLFYHISDVSHTMEESGRTIQSDDQVIRLGVIGEYDIIKVIDCDNIEFLYFGRWNDGVRK